MRYLTTALTAAALALGLVAQASPARAVATYDSAYAGESAFLTLERGATGSFTVFFQNTGSTSWVKGTATQVDLAACRDDKVTCDAQDASDAAFNSGWLSTTRYATTVQSTVGAGQLGTFTYSVKVPDDAAASTHAFNGALVLASTGADIHNEGYYQAVTVSAPAAAAATLTAVAPTRGSIAGGTTVTITGTGFVCSPMPTVSFGGTAGTVTACGQASIVARTPAHAAGATQVTVTNSGASASNGVDFTFVDDVPPTLDSIAAQGQTVTMTFDEPVCTDGGTLTPNTDLRVRVDGADVTETNIAFADCATPASATTATVQITDAIPSGATVSLTITATGAAAVQDEAGNAMAGAVTRTTTEVADTTKPTIDSATAADEQTLELTYSEPVTCGGTAPGQFVFDPDASGSNVTATSYSCDSTTTVAVGFPTNTFAGGATGKLQYTAGADPIADLAGNKAADQSIAISPTSLGAPLITSAVVSRNGFRFSADMGDVITLTFNEAMDTSVTGDVIRVKDGSGVVADISCTGTATDNDSVLDASCTYSGKTLTMTLLESSAGETTGGGTTSLAWPATIVDTSNVTDRQGDAVDLGGSTDTSIDPA